MAILTAQGDFSFKMFCLKSKFYWDFAYNGEGAKRFNDIYLGLSFSWTEFLVVG